MITGKTTFYYCPCLRDLCCMKMKVSWRCQRCIRIHSKVPHSMPVTYKSQALYEPATHVGSCELLPAETDKSRYCAYFKLYTFYTEHDSYPRTLLTIGHIVAYLLKSSEPFQVFPNQRHFKEQCTPQYSIFTTLCPLSFICNPSSP